MEASMKRELRLVVDGVASEESKINSEPVWLYGGL